MSRASLSSENMTTGCENRSPHELWKIKRIFESACKLIHCNPAKMLGATLQASVGLRSPSTATGSPGLVRSPSTRAGNASPGLVRSGSAAPALDAASTEPLLFRCRRQSENRVVDVRIQVPHPCTRLPFAQPAARGPDRAPPPRPACRSTALSNASQTSSAARSTQALYLFK